MRLLLNSFILVILCIGIIYLQIYLSKKENKWFGLILPLITLCFSLIMVASIATYTQIGSTKLESVSVSEDGEVIQEAAEYNKAKQPLTDTGSLIGTAIFVFFIFNISTAILLTIYFACREKRKRNLALEKMSAQDLG